MISLTTQQIVMFFLMARQNVMISLPGESVGEHAYFTRFVRDNVNKERTLKGQADREG